MSSTAKKVVYVGLAGLAIWGVSHLMGPDNTIIAAHTAVGGSSWGLGVAAGTVKEVAPGLSAGFQASNSFVSSFPAANTQPTPQAAPKPKTSKKAAKVPNCTKAQKKAAPGVCA